MKKRTIHLLAAVAVLRAMALPATASAQELNTIEAHIAAARANPSADAQALLRLCPAGPAADAPQPAAAPTAPRAGPPPRSEWYVEPAKVFDNLYFVGQSAYTAWAVTTSDGIVVIDPLFDYSVEAAVVEGLTKLGFDPRDIKYVVVSHGHSDHAGGARLLQERFGARVVASAADWDLMERNTASWPKPQRDIVVTGDRELRIGDTTLFLVNTPGHTPGTVSTLIPLKDGPDTHLGVLWGGTAFNFTVSPENPRAFWYRAYIGSAERLREMARWAGADVILSNHPGYDGTATKLPAVSRRQPGDPHPYVVGSAAVGEFLMVAAECAKASLLSEG